MNKPLPVPSSFRFSPRPNRANEVAWRPWGVQAFAEARTADKPVLLSISAVWCHWCHVMDETTYSDAAVIARINERYIPIRVDNDHRPDINARYNMGGWPTTAVLTPDGDTITGATYIPPAQMPDFLDDVATFYADHRGEIAEKIATIRERPQPAAERGVLDATIPETVLHTIAEGYDAAYGGFGEAPKFPQTEALEFLLLEARRARAHGDDANADRIFTMLATTALAMARGGMYDHVEGGFFRYSTTRDWSVPHFEKMSEDHGGLLRTYAGLYRISGNPAFRDTLRSAVRYVRTVLFDANTGLFAGSQDADEDYFALPLDARASREAPFVDRTSYTNWACNLAGGLLAAADALDDDAAAATALTAIDTIAEKTRAEDGLARHVMTSDGRTEVSGLLTDQVWLLRALLDAYAYGGDERHRESARRLADATLRTFGDPEGGFIDHANAESALGRVAIVDRPLIENAHLAEALLRLAAITDDARYAAAAQLALERFAPAYRRVGSFAAPYAAAVRRALDAPVVVTLIGEPGDMDDFRRDARGLPDPLVVVRSFTPQSEHRATTGFPADAPRAYVCVGTTCGAPVETASAIHDAYRAML